MKQMLSGIRVAAAALITLTALTQLSLLTPSWLTYGYVVLTTFLLFIRKIPAPFIVLLVMVVGLIF
jgi:chromate transporter